MLVQRLRGAVGSRVRHGLEQPPVELAVACPAARPRPRRAPAGSARSDPTPGGSSAAATAPARLVEREVEVGVRAHRRRTSPAPRASSSCVEVAARGVDVCSGVNRSAARRTASDSSASRTSNRSRRSSTSKSSTRAPWCGTCFASPSASSCRTASRIGEMLMPSDRASSSSRSGVPAGSSPRMIASRSSLEGVLGHRPVAHPALARRASCGISRGPSHALDQMSNAVRGSVSGPMAPAGLRFPDHHARASFADDVARVRGRRARRDRDLGAEAAARAATPRRSSCSRRPASSPRVGGPRGPLDPAAAAARRPGRSGRAASRRLRLAAPPRAVPPERARLPHRHRRRPRPGRRARRPSSTACARSPPRPRASACGSGSSRTSATAASEWTIAIVDPGGASS